ncbi:retron St85 family RNA-directed DNA polymerase [Adlercreutzia equolifaciens]|uniref:RNA-directed DNA polymerase n=1 Tax=Adlercreutzia equolifaciens subsp. celatus DSM 18785 TaxID=1121021 RepID=A0A3N0APU0_9ACTN|nr:retron St85 family RNA-directed DNA polymerase [Adlercreutzia equolifaciens]MCP2078752.1 RNA-directed DNA polymerase [Adlercreutzia equolifaciens subsp. celatus DSM 18785]RFT95278.1 RNA-directed DNA polymerase [Adlercreutzia equolifaciens subsp. celatus]RNL36871.1 hypothetical protein DMP10_09965 [Adlercreutzia equolifaciens subsp. celatus DSM 18785]
MTKTSISALIQSDLGLETGYIESLAERASALYSRIKLKGRRIDAPSPELKLVQCWSSDFLHSADGDLPSFVAAYEPSCSVIRNASMHADHAHIARLDISDFFHSCKHAMVETVFRGIRFQPLPDGEWLKLEEADVTLLARLSCYKGALSVGSPCSPALANRIMLPFDRDIEANIPSSCRYSRYSDDMVFSSNCWIDIAALESTVDEILSTSGFRLNRRKTRCSGKGDRRRVTGVFVTPEGELSIGSKRKHEIKRLLYDYLTKGQGDADVILGLIQFAIQVEPKWASVLLAKYAKYGEARQYGVIGALRNASE